MRHVGLVVALGLWSAAAWAQTPQTRPDFSGTWKLDTVRSRLDNIEQPSNLVLKIEHHEPKLLITATGMGGAGETNETLNLTTDNAPHPLNIGGQSATASAQWDAWSGKRLVWQITRQTPNGPVTITRRATLGSKGKILTTVLTVKDKSGEKKGYEFFFKE